MINHLIVIGKQQYLRLWVWAIYVHVTFVFMRYAKDDLNNCEQLSDFPWGNKLWAIRAEAYVYDSIDLILGISTMSLVVFLRSYRSVPCPFRWGCAMMNLYETWSDCHWRKTVLAVMGLSNLYLHVMVVFIRYANDDLNNSEQLSDFTCGNNCEPFAQMHNYMAPATRSLVLPPAGWRSQ